MSKETLFTLSHIEKRYKGKGVETHALRDISLTIARHDFTVIQGRSGCGKSTLLNLIGAMDCADSGTYHFGAQDVFALDQKALSMFRRSVIGFVFQSFHLIPELTAQGNVEMPMGYAGQTRLRRRERATQLLSQVGLSEKAKHKPSQLSGGEQQRVALARALVNEPQLILADEPTGNLDEATSCDVMELLRQINRLGTTIIMVTHDVQLATYASRIITMQDGRIVDDITQGA